MEGGGSPTFKKFASGLHEALGLAYKDGSFYTVQHGELTKLTDTDGDGIAEGRYVKPENVENEKNPDFLYKAKESFPEFQLPSVILPHGILGISNSQLIMDGTEGKFGPFAGQIFIGDQGQRKIMRVALEKVGGEYQGVAFDFRAGFQSGVMRLDFDDMGNLFAGETNRGWGSVGNANSGLQYLTWTGKTPFEMKTVKAMPDDFEIEFTQPVDKRPKNWFQFPAPTVLSEMGQEWIMKRDGRIKGSQQHYPFFQQYNSELSPPQIWGSQIVGAEKIQLRYQTNQITEISLTKIKFK